VSQSDFVSRGQALVAAGQFQEAVKICRLGLLGRPTTVEGRVVLGQALFALKRYDEVLAEMRVALELDHTSVPAQLLKGDALLRKGDSHAAIEALTLARQLAPSDPRVLELLSEAERSSGKPTASTSHPAVSYVGGGAVGGGDPPTKHYPNHADSTTDREEDTGDSYTKPTSIAASKSKKQKAAPGGTPSPAQLAVGDKSGTVEVDPDLDGIEIADDDDDLAAPPAAAAKAKIGGARGSVKSSRSADEGDTVLGKRGKGGDLELDDDDLDAQQTRLPEPKSVSARRPGASAVRDAISRPSGPLDDPPPMVGRAGLPPPSGRSKAPSSQPPRPMPLGMPPPSPMPPPPLSAGVPPPLSAGLPPPLSAGVPPPLSAGMPTPLSAHMPSAASVAAAARPTIALSAPPPPLSAAQQQSAAAVDAMFGAQEQAPNWAKATMIAPSADPARATAAPHEPTARPGPLDPSIQNMVAGQSADTGSAIAVDPTSTPAQPGELRTGMRKTRSRAQLAVWVVIGIVVIGGGVFAGFQIRKVRLENQIDAARVRAADLAKADTWTGWIAARDSLAGIVQAASTIDNRAALAKARARIVFEFGDGLAEAKSAVDGLAGHGGLDASLAAGFLALAQNDAKAAKAAADAALATADKDATALYLAGEAALLAGDAKTAATQLKAAFDKEPRPLHGAGLARALAASYQVDDALAVVDKVLAGSADHPATVIARGTILAAGGRITPGSTIGNELRAQLEKIIAEGGRPAAEQAHGVSPAQVAFGNLALAQVDYARGDINAARADVRAAAAVMLDDQRFAEEAVETLFLLAAVPGDLDVARKYAERALSTWPSSRRARLALAQIVLAQGRASEALDIIAKQPELVTMPRAQAIRGLAALAAEDVTAARADFDAALKKLPNLEPALIGRVWLDLAAGEGEDAKKLLAGQYKDGAATPAMTIAYAAVLRATGDAASRDKARSLLSKVVAGPPGLDVARGQLELARLQRDAGELRLARDAFAEASRTGNVAARLESGLLAIEDRDPSGGRDTLDQLLKEAGDQPTTGLLLEVARARMLVGDHAGATQLLETASKSPGALAWKLERERGRLALRRGDFAGAGAAFSRALAQCGDDTETFLLAADVVLADDKQPALAEQIKKLSADRLKTRPEGQIVTGKLLLAAGKDVDAEQAYTAAKTALVADKASPRRQAQVHLGLAAAAYFRKDDPAAVSELELVIEQDPSLYNAYLFHAEIVKDKQPKKALDLAQKAVALDPDAIDGWASVGRLASRVNDRKALADAIGRLNDLAPTSEQLKELQALKR
jgi:tetratricopeptide (TPR) repeat protein